MMKKISVNYIMSQLVKLKPNLLWQKELTSTITADLHHPLHSCCCVFFSFHQHFSSLHSFTYLSGLIMLWHPLTFCFLPASKWAAAAWRWLQRLTLAGEKHAEGALWFGSVDRNFAAFTHSVSPPKPTGPSRFWGSSLQIQERHFFLQILQFFHLSIDEQQLHNREKSKFKEIHIWTVEYFLCILKIIHC